MKEGTKSYLIGCHNFLFHPLWVLLAWRLEYKSWPKWWEVICIFSHDIGICGRQYLSDDEAKKGHWFRGAKLACRIVGALKKEPVYWIRDEDENIGLWWKEPLWKKAVDLCAGHCPEESGYLGSRLSRADKRSRLVAPIWWTRWEYWLEFRNIKSPDFKRWRKLVAENLKREKPLGNHELYLKERKWK